MSATASSTPSTATLPAGRIDLLDVLRGVAILGTLGTNIWFFAINATQRDFDTGSDGVVQAISDAITNGKFLGMLAILFGVGLAIQHASAMRRRSRWPWRYEWRNVLLLADGALHFVLVMEFDILMGYAITGMLAAFVVARGDRAIRHDPRPRRHTSHRGADCRADQRPVWAGGGPTRHRGVPLGQLRRPDRLPPRPPPRVPRRGDRDHPHEHGPVPPGAAPVSRRRLAARP